MVMLLTVMMMVPSMYINKKNVVMLMIAMMRMMPMMMMKLPELLALMKIWMSTLPVRRF